MVDSNIGVPVSDWNFIADEEQDSSSDLDFDKDRVFAVDQTRVLIYTASGTISITEDVELERIVKHGWVRQFKNVYS